MKRNIFLCTLGTAAVLAAPLCFADPIAPTTELGAAGPGSLAVLDNGNFSLSFNPATVIINGQPVVEGEINGNLADNAGNVSTSTSGQLLGTVYLGPGASGVSGPNVQTGSSVPASDLAIAFGAGGAASYYNSLPANFTSLPSSPTTLTPGVYSLSGTSLSGVQYTLTAGKVYVFNINGTLSLNQASQFIDSTPQDVIFNVSGNVQTSGGLNNPGEVEIDGVVMAQGQISLTPGFVIPELISDTSINIASGGGVNGGGSPPTEAPDTASSLALLGFGAGLLFLAKAKLAGQRE